MHTMIYEWGTRDDFLLPRLYPEAQVVEAEPLVDDDKILQLTETAVRQYPAQARQWFFHLNISLSEHWLSGRETIISALEQRGYRVFNGRVTDIRKHHLQALTQQLGLGHVSVTADEDPHLRVMVKSDYNYGGIGESQLSPRQAQKLGLQCLDGCSVQTYSDYYLTRLGDVEDHVWDDPRLVVERYIENPDQRFYRFYRCGSKAVLSELINYDVVKKMVPGLPRQNWFFDYGKESAHCYQTLIDKATTLCDHMGLNYGALDMVMDEADQGYIIDVNPTPGWGAEKQGEMLTFLRTGIETQA